MKKYRIAAIQGDGIGTEVIAAGLRVLDALSAREDTFRLEVKSFPWSSDDYLKLGHYIPAGGLDELRTFDAIFFGAVGSQKVPDHVSLSGGCACPSARASISTRTSAPRASCPG